MADLQKPRKQKLNALAREIVGLFKFQKEILPEEIAIDNDLAFYYDNYGKEPDGTGFEGLQIYDGSTFHTHINLDFVGSKDSNRARFAFAHELGHFFIEEHHYQLKRAYHPSKFNPLETNTIEMEANYFAGALLMPEANFQATCHRERFSLALIDKLSQRFRVSDLAALLRFVEVGTYPIMVAYCKGGVLKWFIRNDDFPYKVFKSRVGQAVPPTSVVGEYFRLGSKAKYTDVQTISVDDWFYYHGSGNPTLNEQCFYSDYGYVISIIWPD